MYGKINVKCPYVWIVSVSGSTGDYDLVLSNGVTLEEYDETAGILDTGTPAANDMVTFGMFTGSPLITVANAEVIDATDATNWFGLTDPSA